MSVSTAVAVDRIWRMTVSRSSSSSPRLHRRHAQAVREAREPQARTQTGPYSQWLILQNEQCVKIAQTGTAFLGALMALQYHGLLRHMTLVLAPVALHKTRDPHVFAR